jgi:hypothetical protein
VTTRNVVRAGAVCAITAVSLLATSPAFAATRRDDGDDPGEPMSRLAVLLIFGVLPVALFVIIALLVMAPSIARGPRYRPGLGWQAGPEWYGGPADADAAVQGTIDRPMMAPPPEEPAAPPAEPRTGAESAAPPAEPRTDAESAGGTSARW